VSDDRSQQPDSDKPAPARDEIPLVQQIIDPASGDITEIPVLTEVLPADSPAGDSPRSGAGSTAHDGRHQRQNYTVELLIQEVIDELMPQVEAEFRRRLQTLDEQTLREWLRGRR
jgi:hypothetical protein